MTESRYYFPGFNEEPQSAEDALQEWVATYSDGKVSEEEEELLFSFTDRGADASANIGAIAAGAAYHGIDLDARGIPLPVVFPELEEDEVEQLVASAIATLLWSELEGEEGAHPWEPLDANYDATDVAEESVTALRGELVAFYDSNRSDIAATGADFGRTAHDFILTRNGHGAGFWDRGYGDPGNRLTAAARVYGSLTAYVGDDGRIYFS